MWLKIFKQYERYRYRRQSKPLKSIPKLEVNYYYTKPKALQIYAEDKKRRMEMTLVLKNPFYQRTNYKWLLIHAMY